MLSAQVITSLKRKGSFIRHGSGAGVDGLNASKLEAELVDPSRSEGTSFPTVQDGRRRHEMNASASDVDGPESRCVACG